MENYFQLRMYFFAPFHLSGIQQGIQAGHAAMEYALKYGDDPRFLDFIKNHKTWIILNGGNSTKDFMLSGELGSMNQIEKTLYENHLKFASFREPDLGETLTAICFICDERVFDFENYPDLVDAQFVSEFYDDWVKSVGGNENVVLKQLIFGRHLA